MNSNFISLLIKIAINCSFIYTLLITSVAFGQWEPNVRLTNDPAESLCGINNGWSIAASGNVIHAVWRDKRDGVNGEIYYKRSTDGGTTWQSDINLSQSTEWSATPTIAASASVVIASWDEYRYGNMDIYYRCSYDGGLTWSGVTQLTTDPGGQWQSSIAINGSQVHITWTDNRNSNSEIYYKRSEDAGLTWGSDIRLTNDAADSQISSIAVSGSNVNIVWRDNRVNGLEIWYKKSADGGLTWGADTQLTNDPAFSHYPAIAVSGNLINVTWIDSRASHSDVFYKRSTNGGISWGADSKLTNNNPYTTMYPSIAASGSFVAIVYLDFKYGESEVSYLCSTNQGVTWNETRLTNDTDKSEGPSVAISGAAVHVVWHQRLTDNWEIYYKHNLSGNPTNVIPDPLTGNSQVLSLMQNFPNPLSSSTTIKFQTAISGNIKVNIYDVFGKEVATLLNKQLLPGNYEINYDASSLSSGIYYYTLNSGNFSVTKKMTIIK